MDDPRLTTSSPPHTTTLDETSLAQRIKRLAENDFVSVQAAAAMRLDQQDTHRRWPSASAAHNLICSFAYDLSGDHIE
jgi:hypothetical protein